MVRPQVNWQDLDFSRLIKALKIWKEINPIVRGTENAGRPDAKFRYREKPSHVNNLTTPTQRECVYFDATDQGPCRATSILQFETMEIARPERTAFQL